MNGPLTCEELRNIRPRLIQSELDKFVSTIVDAITKSILDKASCDCSMSAPIDLNTLAQDVYLFPKQSVKPTYQFIYQTSRLLTHTNQINMNLIQSHINKAVILTQVIDKLRQKFTDIRIIVDPLETYILFDWSG
jgi:hypothetical protein